MTDVRVEVRKYVNGSYPGWVGCRMTDAHGRE